MKAIEIILLLLVYCLIDIYIIKHMKYRNDENSTRVENIWRGVK